MQRSFRCFEELSKENWLIQDFCHRREFKSRIRNSSTVAHESFFPLVLADHARRIGHGPTKYAQPDPALRDLTGFPREIHPQTGKVSDPEMTPSPRSSLQ